MRNRKIKVVEFVIYEETEDLLYYIETILKRNIATKIYGYIKIIFCVQIILFF